MPEITATLGALRRAVGVERISAPLHAWRKVLGIRAMAIPPDATDLHPTEAQKQAGNYRKARVTWNGLDLAIENPRGSTRSGVDRDGTPWSTVMQHHYGYVAQVHSRTAPDGADGDKCDVFIGPRDDSPRVFVINQVDPETGHLDEHKIMLGFGGYDEAAAGYLAHYPAGWHGLGSIRELSVEQFKDWLKHGDTTVRAAAK